VLQRFYKVTKTETCQIRYPLQAARNGYATIRYDAMMMI